MRKITQVVVMGFLIILCIPTAFARKKLPSEANPIVYKGIKFQPHFYTDAGVIEAFEVETGKKTWEKKVFQIEPDPSKEWDNQWECIASLQVTGDGELIAVASNGKSYKIAIPKNILKT